MVELIKQQKSQEGSPERKDSFHSCSSAQNEAILKANRALSENGATVNYIEFNRDHSYITVGTSTGFMVKKCIGNGGLQTKINRSVPGGVSKVVLLEQSNIIVYVGTGQNPDLPTDKLVVWDE